MSHCSHFNISLGSVSIRSLYLINLKKGHLKRPTTTNDHYTKVQDEKYYPNKLFTFNK